MLIAPKLEKFPPNRLLPLPPNVYPLPHHYATIFKLQPDKNSIFSWSHCSYSIFVLISYSLDTQVILIDVQYSQEAVFSSEKGSKCQNHSSSGSLQLVKKFPPVKFPIGPNPLLLFERPQYIKLYGPLYAPLWGDSLLFTSHSWYSSSISGGWKAEMTLKPNSGFELVYYPSYYQI